MQFAMPIPLRRDDGRIHAAFVSTRIGGHEMIPQMATITQVRFLAAYLPVSRLIQSSSSASAFGEFQPQAERRKWAREAAIWRRQMRSSIR
jgi:hypothetical protein